MTTYEARGHVRGPCGHRHRTLEAARACAERDRKACAALGGGAYSDRSVYEVETGRLVPDVDEDDDLDDELEPEPAPRRRGRPPKPPAERRTERIEVVATLDERRRIEGHAAARGMDVSAYVRGVALNPPPKEGDE